jgi:hypothetical protein
MELLKNLPPHMSHTTGLGGMVGSRDRQRLDAKLWDHLESAPAAHDVVLHAARRPVHAAEPVSAGELVIIAPGSEGMGGH